MSYTLSVKEAGSQSNQKVHLISLYIGPFSLVCEAGLYIKRAPFFIIHWSVLSCLVQILVCPLYDTLLWLLPSFPIGFNYMYMYYMRQLYPCASHLFRDNMCKDFASMCTMLLQQKITSALPN